MPVVSGTRRQRAAKRLARIRLTNPNALPGVNPSDGYTPREARKIKSKHARMKARGKFEPKRSGAPAFNPLAAVTPQGARKEIRAQARTEFGPRAQELRNAIGAQEQTTANTGTYYDDYRKLLAESTARINATNAANVQAQEQRVDTAYSQDKASVASRDAAVSEQAAKLGRGPVTTEAGHRAVEAQRTAGNESVGRLRGQASADTKYMELRGATSGLAKAEALRREGAKREKLRTEEKNLAADKGAFKVAARSKMRESERSWAAIKQEFGLKERELRLDSKSTRQDRQLERQKLAAQKIVARIYGSADRAGARAQIRVAQLQLKKGKIDAEQYKTIRNIYEGLPGGKGGGKDADKPKLQTWERDKVTNAINILTGRKAHARDKQTWLKRMQAEGVPLRLARVAWARYIKQQNNAVNTSPGGDKNQ